MGHKPGNHAIGKIRPISPSEYTFRLAYLKDSMRLHEDITRQNSGSNKGGLRLADGATWEFSRYCLEQAWKSLAAETPAAYAEYASGAKGQYYPVRITCAHYAAITKFSKQEREGMKGTFGANYGSPKALKNATKTIYEIRKKITSTNRIEHSNGATSEGFDLFLRWSGVNAEGAEEIGGRNGCIGYINLEYVFAKAFQSQNTENEPTTDLFSLPRMEDFSPILSTILNKNQVERENGIPDGNVQPLNAEIKIKADQKGDSKPSVDFPTENLPLTKRFFAFKLWALIMTRIYVPMLLAGRVQFAKNKYTRADFSAKTEENAVLALEKMLETYTFEELANATEWQAEWLGKDAGRYIYTPMSFLNTEYRYGTLISALRELGPKTDFPRIPNEISSEITNDRDLLRRIRLMGAEKIQLFTVQRWIRTKGLEYMNDICVLFQRKKSNKKVNIKNIDHAFALMVYYGHEKIDALHKERMDNHRLEVRNTADAQKWNPYFERMAVMGVDEMRQLDAKCKEVFGIGFKTKKEVMNSRGNAVLFAWLMEQNENKI